MAFYRSFFFTTWILTATAIAGTPIEKKETINGVTVETGKEDSTRLYRGSISKNFPYSLETVKNSVVNFDEKCNNSFKERREFTDKNKECKYHNDNLVETIIIKNINKSGWTKEENEIERYLLGRLVYNRGNFGYYELVTVTEGQNDKGQKTLTIKLKMLDDKEAKIYTKPSFEKDSAFDESDSTFILTQISPKETNLNYEYEAETEHWILNKEVSVPQVFASISKSINDLVKTVDAESSLQSRDIASN